MVYYLPLFLFAILGVYGSLPDHLYGLWYCGDDGCDWDSEPNLDNAHWLVDRGDGKPTANVVIFAFLSPIDLLKRTNNSHFLNGVPRGMTKKVVNYFQSKGVVVILSIGGASFSDDGNWDKALSDPVTLAKNAAAVAKNLGVGMEIDYEVDNGDHISALNQFVQEYRNNIPQTDEPQSILTVDMGDSTNYLTQVAQSVAKWLNSSHINWANAMVSDGPYTSINQAAQSWNQHLNGADNVPPIDPTKLVVSLFTSNGAHNCHDWDGTVLQQAIPWVEQKHVRGIFFWACGCVESCIQDCQGVEQGSKEFLP